MADPQSLIAIFTASYAADPAVRKAAEQQLRQVETTEGMLSACLQLISSDHTPKEIRLAASVYLKNRVARSWRSGTDPNIRGVLSVPIPVSDRLALKQNLLPVLVAAPPNIKVQMTSVMAKVVHEDFPEQWPGLLESVLTVIRAAQPEQMEGGLLALLEILRNYRYIRDRTIPDQIAAEVMPILVSLGSSLLASAPLDQAPELVGRLLHLILKSYRLTMQTELPSYHQQSIVAWGTLLLQIVNRQIPASAMPEDESERQKTEWWKAKKWAYYILNRLYSRYGSPSQLAGVHVEVYGSFAATFEQSFAPEILKAYMHQIELQVNGQSWLSERCTRYIIEFLQDTVKPKSMWTLLKPHVPVLIERFLFPIFCPTDEELEEFREEPKDWIRNHAAEMIATFFEKPSFAAQSFLDELVNSRKKTAMLPLLTFINTVVTEYPTSRSPKEKDGAMKMLNSVADSIVKSKQFGKQMEPFFVHHVLPEIHSPHGHLRARACEMIEKFEGEDMHWEDKQNLDRMLQASLNLLNDPELPVKVCAAIALPETVRYTQVRDLLAPNIGRVMQELLALANEVDLDRLTQAMRTLFSSFSEELLPFAVELSATLRDSYLRVIHEALESRHNTDDEDSIEDKTLNAMGILKTVDELVGSAQELPEALARIEENVLPMITYTLEHDFVELITEVCEIVDTITFFRRAISSSMWTVFELLYKCFKGPAVDFLDEMSPVFDNLITYGTEMLTQSPQHLDMMVDIYSTTMASTALGANDRVYACKIGSALLLSLRGRCDRIMPKLLEPAVAFITREKTDEEPIITTGLYNHALELIIHAIYANPLLTVAYLDHSNATSRFFSAWFDRLELFTRVHDRKIGILAISSLFEAMPNAPPSVVSFARELMVGVMIMFGALPTAINKRKQEELDVAKRNADGDAEDEAGVSSDEEVPDDYDVPGDTNDLADYIKSHAEEDDDDGSAPSEAWTEERLFFSPLDQLDAYGRFAEVFSTLQTTQPAIFERVTGALTGDQQRQLGEIAAVASAGGERSLAAPPPKTNGHV